MRILEIIREVKFLESGQGGTSEGFGFVNRRAGACAAPRIKNGIAIELRGMARAPALHLVV